MIIYRLNHLVKRSFACHLKDTDDYTSSLTRLIIFTLVCTVVGIPLGIIRKATSVRIIFDNIGSNPVLLNIITIFLRVPGIGFGLILQITFRALWDMIFVKTVIIRQKFARFVCIMLDT